MFSHFTNNVLKAASFLLLQMVAFVTLALSFFAPELATEFFGGGLGGVMLAETVGGTVTYEETETKAPGHLKRDISEVVTEVKPDDHPLDTMLRKAKREEKAENMKVEFETVEFRKRKATVSGDTVAGAADAQHTITLASQANVNVFHVDDGVFIPTVQASNGEEFRGVVVAKDVGASTIDIFPLNNDTVPAITDQTAIYRLGPGKSELDAKTEASHQLPTDAFNYCQIYMEQVEQSKLREMMDSYSKYGYVDHVNQSIYDFRNSMESDSLFGVRKKFLHPTKNQMVYRQNGVVRLIERNINYTPGNLTWQELIDWSKDIFAGNNGSADRLLLGGKDLVADIAKIDNVQKQQGAESTKVVQGVNVSEIDVNFGNIMIKHHKMFDEMGLPDEGIVLDMMNIRRRVLEKMKREPLELDKTGVKRAKADRILETFCIETRHQDTHARVRPS